MLCEICGEKRAVTKVTTDGIDFSVCDACTKFGREVRRVEVPRVKSVRMDNRDILPDYDSRIRKARESRGLSFKELANGMAVKQSTLEKVERGKMLPDKGLLKKLEKFLNITLTGVVSEGESLRKNLPEATLGDLAIVKKR